MTESILQFFEYKHLPPHLQNISATFHFAARNLVQIAPRNPERTVALRKLLEAKDAAVRSALFKDDWTDRPAQTTELGGEEVRS